MLDERINRRQLCTRSRHLYCCQHHINAVECRHLGYRRLVWKRFGAGRRLCRRLHGRAAAKTNARAVLADVAARLLPLLRSPHGLDTIKIPVAAFQRACNLRAPPIPIVIAIATRFTPAAAPGLDGARTSEARDSAMWRVGVGARDVGQMLAEMSGDVGNVEKLPSHCRHAQRGGSSCSLLALAALFSCGS